VSYHGRRGLGADAGGRPVLPAGCDVPSYDARRALPANVQTQCGPAWNAELIWQLSQISYGGVIGTAAAKGMEEAARQMSAKIAADPKIQKDLEDARRAAAQIAPGVGFVPKVCESLQRYERPPATIPAGSVLTMAYPFVTASDAQVNAIIAALLLVGSPNRPSGLGAVESVASGVGRVQRFSPVLEDYWWKYPDMARKLTLLAAGWMPDGEGSRVTRGTLWVATAWDSSVLSLAAERQTRYLKGVAVAIAGVSPEATLVAEVAAAFAASPGQVSEESLKRGAFRSSIAGLEFATLVQNMVRMPAIRKSSSDIAAPLKNGAAQVSAAQVAVAQVPGIPATVAAAIASVQVGDPVAGQAQLQRVRSVLVATRGTITAGVGAVTGVISGGKVIRENFLTEMRQALIAQANEQIRGFREDLKWHTANEYYRCLTLQEGYRSLQVQVGELLTGVTAALEAATSLIHNANDVRGAIAILDEQIELIDEAIRELPLSFWQRTTLGVPRWGLAAGGGTVAFLGLALGARAVVKKKRRAQGSAPKKNRRRR